MSSPVFERLSALAEPTRARMLRVLAVHELAVGELARVLQTSQPTVSRHLKQLDAGGWVLRRKVGTATCYRVDAATLEPEAAALWAVVRAPLDEDALDPASLYAEDLRRLDGVLAERSADSEELFRRLGGRWDEVRQELFGEACVLPALLALLPPGLTIVDLGCGTGAMLPLLAPVAARVVGVDREEAMLEVARARVEGLDNVTLLRGRLDDLPIDSDGVDLAVCALVLHHVRELGPVLAEARRVLRPGGRLVVLDMGEHDREDYRQTMGHQHLGFSREQVGALAAGAGLSLASWRLLPPDPRAHGPGLFVAVLGRG